MNLNNQPTINELARLFAAQKDTLSDHILWVSDTGEVRIEPVTACHENTPFEEHRPALRTHLKMYRRGQGYVGKKAAADKTFITEVLQTLTLNWEKAQTNADIVKVDRYS
ncbi:hypothetical protein [Pseudomonas weihenstephanensis]|uniref:Uncharacterized protein n=1 Tax=Pseudomonas weihenstephanensis TaxID=1608994 RepID=A0A0J6J1R6_9PSED|nr:hypothetical protein [Pseudomonas weihenstephanensis]KMN12700.1 hypothetical protein TU86_16980 [Pseudomonas weihenstephanensis]KMN20655.1 hypothetical protein TU87_03610 [Pseudomonas weihenstephanensis]MBM1189398.1 hypothetical protein [Pseudomonas weihenstephanensis]GLX90447.1 hypothetical protein Pfra02_30150 [Pseudomonas fragi]